MSIRDEAPAELVLAVVEFWPDAQVENALAIARLESSWSAFALNDTTGVDRPCGAQLSNSDGVIITAERSVGWFQINACNIPPDWDWHHLYNTRHNAGTAHKLWADAGGSWSPWFFSARKLGLL